MVVVERMTHLGVRHVHRRRAEAVSKEGALEGTAPADVNVPIGIIAYANSAVEVGHVGNLVALLKRVVLAVCTLSEACTACLPLELKIAHVFRQVVTRHTELVGCILITVNPYIFVSNGLLVVDDATPVSINCVRESFVILPFEHALMYLLFIVVSEVRLVESV